jgi:predicted transcriptional regulator
MKSASIPSIRVEPALREQVEAVLAEGESLSEFVETSVRDGLRRRQVQAEFVARGMASLAKARASGEYVEVADTLAKLDAMLVASRQAKKRRLGA